jgi:Domain of unknown function (DUF4412)
MKSIFSSFLFTALIFCFLATISFSQSFEGKITMKITSKDQDNPQTIEYYCKDNKIRFEGMGSHEEAGGAFIMDTKTNEATIIMPAQKMYMSYSFKNLLGASSDTLKNKLQKEMDKGNIKMTGETKNINGYDCEKWTFKGDDGTNGEAWMTKGVRNFFFFNNPMNRGNEPDWQKKLTGEGYFPMLVITKDSDGNIDSKMEVTSVEKKSLDESLFNPPSDYRKMEMPNMMQGK